MWQSRPSDLVNVSCTLKWNPNNISIQGGGVKLPHTTKLLKFSSSEVEGDGTLSKTFNLNLEHTRRRTFVHRYSIGTIKGKTMIMSNRIKGDLDVVLDDEHHVAELRNTIFPRKLSILGFNIDCLDSISPAQVRQLEIEIVEPEQMLRVLTTKASFHQLKNLRVTHPEALREVIDVLAIKNLEQLNLLELTADFVTELNRLESVGTLVLTKGSALTTELTCKVGKYVTSDQSYLINDVERLAIACDVTSSYDTNLITTVAVADLTDATQLSSLKELELYIKDPSTSCTLALTFSVTSRSKLRKGRNNKI